MGSSCWKRRGPMGVTDVARLMGVTKQAASKLVRGMSKAGYLRDVAAQDGRARAVSISPRGRKLLDAVEEIYVALEKEWADTIGESRLEALRRDIAQVLVARHGHLPSVRPPSTT